MSRDWHCPQCSSAARTFDSKIPWHRCAGLAGLVAPLIDVGTRGESKAIERGDYINGEAVQLDANGRPVMAIVTTRDDGQDCTIFAPCASLGLEANGMD